MRINKYLALSALASRRKSEDYIRTGRVKVNGKVLTDLSYDVAPGDKVTVDGKYYCPVNKLYYIMINKPKGCVTSTSDEKGRRTVMDYIDQDLKRYGVKPVGRLDYNTEGLLLMTNDGDTAYRLTHPKFSGVKEYTAITRAPISDEQLKILRSPIEIDGRMTKPALVHINIAAEDYSEFVISITEGRNRQVRRLCEAAGIDVYRLIRTKFNSLNLKGLKRGAWRHLTDEEVRLITNTPKKKVPK